MSTTAVLITLGSFMLGTIIALLNIPILVWLERRIAGLIQDRLGPNRTNIFGFRLGGVVQSFADVVKLVLKEEYYPSHIKNGRFIFMLAPIIAFVSALLAFMVIPFADSILIDGKLFRIQPLPIDFGIFWYLAFSALGVLGVVFGGILSHNKYSLLGAVRAGSMMISYELSLGLSVLAFIITYNTIDFNQMVQAQSSTFFFILPAWGILLQPIASIILIVSLFAETNRNPFSVSEGESEIVAGFMTEYTAMKFAMFFMGEYIAMNTASAVIITMVFGGYQLPFISTPILLENFKIFTICIMVVVPVITYILIKWMKTNNQVRPSVSNDGGRIFEAKVLSIFMIVATVFIEIVLLYLLFINENAVVNTLVVTIFQIVTFIIKLMIFNIFFIIIRWTIPRFRYDQIQKLGWNYLLPISIANIFITASIVVVFSL